MGTLALVRHGQASFFADNYDQLSPLGEEQARLLGQYWVERGVRFDEVFTGPRVRQIETAALVGEQFRAAGIPWPEARMLPELDEHQVDRLIKSAMHKIIEHDPEIHQLHTNYKNAESPGDKHRTFQLMFERVVVLWTDGHVSDEEVESWSEFRQRVDRGLRTMLDVPGRGRSVAAFTSVGAVTVCLHAALGCSVRTALDLGWRVRNASVTDFVFGRGRLTLEGFNSFSHLASPDMWTFR
jgi:broad specificity phosphatase PhoE